MTRTTLRTGAVMAMGFALAFSFALPAFAASTTTQARAEAAISKAETRAKQEITRRIDALTKLATRVSEMKRLSDSEKSTLSANITAQINTLNTLEAKIAADTDAATLKADVQSITKSYRIFALIIPQGAIAAAADRIEAIAASSTELSAKLSTRITAAGAAGKDTTAMTTSLSDMNAKIADANTQAQAAVSETASLQPDNGDKTVMTSNTAALKDARSKIQAAEKDLKAAKADAESIVKAVKGSR